MSTKFFNNIEEQIQFANISNGSLKTVAEARGNLKKIIGLAVTELNTLMILNEKIDKMISSGHFLDSSEYEELCNESQKYFHDIHNMQVVQDFNILIDLLSCPDTELAGLADELIYLMHIHEDAIKARQNMRFGRLFGK